MYIALSLKSSTMHVFHVAPKVVTSSRQCINKTVKTFKTNCFTAVTTFAELRWEERGTVIWFPRSETEARPSSPLLCLHVSRNSIAQSFCPIGGAESSETDQIFTAFLSGSINHLLNPGMYIARQVHQPCKQ